MTNRKPDSPWGESPQRKYRTVGLLRTLAKTASSDRIRLEAIKLLLRLEGIYVVPEMKPFSPDPEGEAADVPNTSPGEQATLESLTELLQKEIKEE